MPAHSPSNDPELSLIAPFVPADQRDAVLGFYRLLGDIRQGIFAVNDESLARVKLSWWRDEIERLLNHQASHPTAVALDGQGDIRRLESEELGDALEGLLMRLEGRLYNDDDELLLHCWRNEGVLAVCAARLAGATSNTALRAARDFGLARGLAAVVLNFEADRQAGRCWLPLTGLRDADLKPEELLAHAPAAAQRQRLLQPVVDMASHYHDAGASAAIGGEERASLRAPALLAALSDRDLKRSRQAGFRPRPSGPFGRLMSVWRAARREARAG